MYTVYMYTVYYSVYIYIYVYDMIYSFINYMRDTVKKWPRVGKLGASSIHHSGKVVRHLLGNPP